LTGSFATTGYVDDIIITSTNSAELWLNVWLNGNTNETLQFPIAPGSGGSNVPQAQSVSFVIASDFSQLAFRLSTAQQSQSDPSSSGFSGVNVYVLYRTP
jgi:hypothetical protein